MPRLAAPLRLIAAHPSPSPTPHLQPGRNMAAAAPSTRLGDRANSAPGRRRRARACRWRQRRPQWGRRCEIGKFRVAAKSRMVGGGRCDLGWRRRHCIRVRTRRRWLEFVGGLGGLGPGREVAAGSSSRCERAEALGTPALELLHWMLKDYSVGNTRPHGPFSVALSFHVTMSYAQREPSGMCHTIYIFVCLVISGMVPYTLLGEDAPLAEAFAAKRLRFVTVLSIGVVADLTTTLLVGMYVQRLFWAVLPEDADQEGSRATRRERWCCFIRSILPRKTRRPSSSFAEAFAASMETVKIPTDDLLEAMLKKLGLPCPKLDVCLFFYAACIFGKQILWFEIEVCGVVIEDGEFMCKWIFVLSGTRNAKCIFVAEHIKESVYQLANIQPSYT
ncbi:hypothetical protein QYE76_006503 [Lolium multiflorum]|uniref:Uncharacterized protein n=1 Tax=Lolium multiflorum TaxID=4521 RepID=A0AAD8RUU7_LOLMU|nr:hypothetical protein QYE76_006503 [Lolium multiflorum]